MFRKDFPEYKLFRVDYVKMKFKQLKYDFLRYAKEFCFSEKYSVFCTGRSAFICDKALKLLGKIENLSYVYHAFVSPDEKTLLLVSTSNIFYLVDLNDFSVKKHTVRGKYNNNLEGMGCWSLNGKSLYFCVCNGKTLNSALRCYDLGDNMSYKDLLEEKYWLVCIKPVKEINKYLLIGLDRNKSMLDRIDRWNLIWFDGVSFEEYPIWDVDVSDDCVSSAEYEAATNTVIIYGHTKTFRCDLYGKIVEDLSLSKPEPITASFSNVLSNLDIESNQLDALRKLSGLFGMENISLDDSIYKVCLSLDGKKYYVGTHLGISVIDAETKSVLAKKKIDYGVQNITEISPNVIVVSTWGGVKVFEIVD